MIFSFFFRRVDVAVAPVRIPLPSFVLFAPFSFSTRVAVRTKPPLLNMFMYGCVLIGSTWYFLMKFSLKVMLIHCPLRFSPANTSASTAWYYTTSTPEGAR